MANDGYISLDELTENLAKWSGRPPSEIEHYVRRLREAGVLPRQKAGKGNAKSFSADQLLSVFFAMCLGGADVQESGSVLTAARRLADFGKLPFLEISETHRVVESGGAVSNIPCSPLILSWFELVAPCFGAALVSLIVGTDEERFGPPGLRPVEIKFEYGAVVPSASVRVESIPKDGVVRCLDLVYGERVPGTMFGVPDTAVVGQYVPRAHLVRIDAAILGRIRELMADQISEWAAKLPPFDAAKAFAAAFSDFQSGEEADRAVLKALFGAIGAVPAFASSGAK